MFFTGDTVLSRVRSLRFVLSFSMLQQSDTDLMLMCSLFPGPPATSIQNPTWNICSDTNRTEAILTRFKVIDSLITGKTLVLAFHEYFQVSLPNDFDTMVHGPQFFTVGGLQYSQVLEM